MRNVATFGRITRRGVFRVALAAVSAGAALTRDWTVSTLASPSAQPGEHLVYVFDPAAQSEGGKSGCASCAACQRHARNKLFATWEAAESRRAHPNCRCAIRSVSVPSAGFARMFGAPKAPTFRAEFDIRWSVQNRDSSAGGDGWAGDAGSLGKVCVLPRS